MLKYTGPINRALVEQGVKRTSNLLAPIMLLEGIILSEYNLDGDIIFFLIIFNSPYPGHDGEIYCGKFAPDGRSFISAGFDRHIMYWDVFGECTNYHQIPHAHKVL